MRVITVKTLFDCYLQVLSVMLYLNNESYKSLVSLEYLRIPGLQF
jgi:hypothetical protein